METNPTMKAVVVTQYGPPEVLQFRALQKPVPKDHEVLIRVMATTAHIGDTKIRRSNPFLVRLVFGLFRPKKNLVLGLEVAGIIEAIGKQVKSFQKGDQVFALTGFGLGGYAEYICLPEQLKRKLFQRKALVVLKPKNLSYGAAATVPAGGLTALKNIHKAQPKKGQHILINGASGSLGTYAIQLSKYFGLEVTAVCSANNFDLVRSLGADHLIDYTKNDFTKTGTKYDIIYDAVMKSKHRKCRKILIKRGAFLNNSNTPKIKSEDLIFLKTLIEQGQLRPVIDRSYPLDKVVDAHHYVDQGHKKGNVILLVTPEELTAPSI